MHGNSNIKSCDSCYCWYHRWCLVSCHNIRLSLSPFFQVLHVISVWVCSPSFVILSSMMCAVKLNIFVRIILQWILFIFCTWLNWGCVNIQAVHAILCNRWVPLSLKNVGTYLRNLMGSHPWRHHYCKDFGLF